MTRDPKLTTPSSQDVFGYFNVTDEFKGNSVSQIKTILEERSFPGAVAMMHINGDFNFSSVIRNANAFGITKVFYVGGKRNWDRRGAVGTHNYIDVVHCRDEEQFLDDTKHYHLVGLENNIDFECTSLYDFDWPPMSMIMIGEEGKGLSDEMLQACDSLVYIPQYGSVRSINASTAAGIALNNYAMQQQKGKYNEGN